MADGWVLGIDVGTTWTAAAAYRDGRVEIVALGANQSPSVPTVVHRQPGQPPLIGDAAVRRASSEPGMVARDFKRRLGDSVPLTLGGVPVSADQLYADVLRWVVATASSLAGSQPIAVGITHPANWGPYKLDLLRNAARLADLPSPTFLSEPEAAAIHYAGEGRVADGDAVAVYDLGGGTFDACVLRATGAGTFEVLGRPEGVERLGGIDFDQAVFEHVRTSAAIDVDAIDQGDEASMTALNRLRTECTLAKEALSSDTTTSIPVLLPGLQTQVRLTRDELESRLREPLQLTIDSLSRSIRDAGLTRDQVGSVLLVGGSSRIPMVGRLVSEAVGRPVAVDANPKHSVAAGAARAAAKAAGFLGGDGDAAPAAATAVEASAVPSMASAPTAPPATALVEPVAPVGAFVAPTKRKDRRPLIAALIAIVVAGIAAALLLGGGDDGDDDEVTADAPTTTDADATATTAGVAGDAPAAVEGEVTELDQTFGYLGYIFEFGQLTVTPPADEFSNAQVTLTGTMENRGLFAAQVQGFDLEIDGVDHEPRTALFYADPASTAEVELIYDVAPDAVEGLATSVLRVGPPTSNQAVVPIGGSAEVEAVLHPSVSQDVEITATFGPGDRYGTGTIEVTQVDLGASLGFDAPPEGDNLWFAVRYETCTEELDTFLIPVLVLPDGDREVAEGVEILDDGSATHGSPITVTCPDTNEGIAFWQIPPDVAGQELTVDLDDSGSPEHVAGSFTVTVPEAPDEKSPPE